MSFLRQLALGSRGALPRLCPEKSRPFWSAASSSRNVLPAMHGQGGNHRSFSTADPYKALDVERNASDAEIKRAYRDKALKWHPDKNPDNKDVAEKRFAEASEAYDILKEPETRREYDTTGQVGGGRNGRPGGFQNGGMSQADAERIFREQFGQQGMSMDEILQQMFQQQHGMMGQRPQPRGLQVGMDVKVRADIATIHTASRACGMATDNDERRARCAGKVGTIVAADPGDQSVKMRVMVKPGRADEVWFGAGAVEMLPDPEELGGPQASPFSGQPGGFQHPFGQQRQRGCGGPQPRPQPPRPEGPQPGMEVQIESDVETIHKASRACGIDADNDERRARCAGKLGTIVDTDPSDKSLKVRVMVLPGRADEVWFGSSAVEVLKEQQAPEADLRTSPRDAGASAF